MFAFIGGVVFIAGMLLFSKTDLTAGVMFICSQTWFAVYWLSRCEEKKER